MSPNHHAATARHDQPPTIAARNTASPANPTVRA